METLEDKLNDVLTSIHQQGRVPDLRCRQLAIDKIQEAKLWVRMMYQEKPNAETRTGIVGDLDK